MVSGKETKSSGRWTEERASMKNEAPHEDVVKVLVARVTYAAGKTTDAAFVVSAYEYVVPADVKIANVRLASRKLKIASYKQRDTSECILYVSRLR